MLPDSISQAAVLMLCLSSTVSVSKHMSVQPSCLKLLFYMLQSMHFGSDRGRFTEMNLSNCFSLLICVLLRSRCTLAATGAASQR